MTHLWFCHFVYHGSRLDTQPVLTISGDWSLGQIYTADFPSKASHTNSTGCTIWGSDVSNPVTYWYVLWFSYIIYIYIHISDFRCSQGLWSLWSSWERWSAPESLSGSPQARSNRSILVHRSIDVASHVAIRGLALAICRWWLRCCGFDRRCVLTTCDHANRSWQYEINDDIYI